MTNLFLSEYMHDKIHSISNFIIYVLLGSKEPIIIYLSNMLKIIVMQSQIKKTNILKRVKNENGAWGE